MSASLKLRQLVCFIAVGEELSFRRAAERLFITQPPLSRQIKALEESLGLQLFDRDRQGVRLTDGGAQFLSDARRLVRESEQLHARFGSGRLTAPAGVTLGITTVIDAGRFAGVEAAYAERFPGGRLTVKRQKSARSIRDLQRGRLDVAVIGLPSHAEGLTVAPLFDDPMLACIPSTHPAAKRRRLSILDLSHDPLFWFDRKLNPAYDDHCQRVFDRLGFRPMRLTEPADHHVLLGLVAAGQGVALVPRSLRSIGRRGVSYVALREGEQLQISVGAAHRAMAPSAAATGLVALLRERFSEADCTPAGGRRVGQR